MKGGKEPAVSSSSYSENPNNTNSGEHRDDEKARTLVRLSSRNASSKYDFVKVKVWLGDNADHYYVLSRFLLSRTLTVTKIPNHVAIKIALELKKLLIDNSLLDVSQSDLEANLFKLMERRGYGEEYINRYKMMTRFHHQRVPLVILVCGTACVGKSTIATQLAQRLNLPNVLQTDMVYELLRTSTDAPLASTPVWARDFTSSEELITEFCRECRIVRKGLAGDLKKAMKDGKPIIIEGIHLDPSIYLMDDENKTPRNTATKVEVAKPVPMTMDDDPATQKDNSLASDSRNYTESINSCPENETSETVVPVKQVNELSDLTESVDLVGIVSEHQGETVMPLKEQDTPVKKEKHGAEPIIIPLKEQDSPVKKEKHGAEPIIIPIVLKMAEFDHKALLEEWVSARTFSDRCPVQDRDRLMSNLKIIQDYLCSFESQGLTVANISATTFPQTLDRLHGYLLQCIEQGISSKFNENGRTSA